jgi:hypothetical protein
VHSRPSSKENKEPVEEFKAFTGEGFSLRQKLFQEIITIYSYMSNLKSMKAKGNS